MGNEIDNLPEFEAGKGVDLTEFDKITQVIEGVEQITVKSQWDVAGNELPAGKERNVQALKVYTKPITTLDTPTKGKVDVRASELFNLKEKNGTWGISKSEKSKIQKFLKAMKVKKINDTIGKNVVIKSYENSKGNVYLGFYI